MAAYLGYIAHVGGRTPAWEDLFDVAQLTEFVRWHAARLERPISTLGQGVVEKIAAMAKVLKHPHARELADVRNQLPTPAPMHTKRDHWVSLATLEAVAEACLTEGRAPYVVDPRVSHPGVTRSIRFQQGLMLKLLVRVPLRQRNIRELRLGKHLYQDQSGHWQLHLSGDDLKIGTRQGRPNEYNLNLSTYRPEFGPVLEEFIRTYRPRLPGAAASTLLFLTQYGNQYTGHGLHGELSAAVALRTGQRFYPHLIRTIWATEFLSSGPAPDFVTAAVMLGDTVAVVMRTYHDVIQRDQHAKAGIFLSTALHTG